MLINLQLLLEAGANPLSKNKEDKNLLGRAREVGASKTLIELLESLCTRNFANREQSETYDSIVTTLAISSDVRSPEAQENIEIISSNELRVLQRSCFLEREIVNQRLGEFHESEY